MPESSNVILSGESNTYSNNSSSNTQINIDWTREPRSCPTYSTELQRFENRNAARAFSNHLEDQSGVRNVRVRSRITIGSDIYEVRWEESADADITGFDRDTSEHTEDSREEEGSTQIDSKLDECDLKDRLYAPELFDSSWHGNKYVYLAPVNGSGSSKTKVSDELYEILKNNDEKEIYVEDNEVKGFKKEVK